MDRLPSIPLIVNDPYFSIWCPADRLTDVHCAHWSGAEKPIVGTAVIDGVAHRFLGLSDDPAMDTSGLTVTPCATESRLRAAGVEVRIRFTTPLLLDQPEVLSMPATFVELSAHSLDGAAHDLALSLRIDDALCYHGAQRPPMMHDAYRARGLQIAYAGQRQQKILCHSGDGITIDWGYAYLAAEQGVRAEDGALIAECAGRVVPDQPLVHRLIAAYDDVASINYFGRLCPAWYARNGATILDALATFHARRGQLLADCAALDARIMDAARALGGEAYERIVCAAYRQSIGAHKLIADERGEMVFLSKENDSNGCIGTADVSYPSIPLYLLFNPEFVRAMCRPILKFAAMPVWPYDFAPHDVGRYPHATGQVYGSVTRREYRQQGCVFPPYYLYPASAEVYELRGQMPVEECGNMLIMLAAAAAMDGDASLAARYADTLDQWVRYLLEFGEDPGEQLCTDDFAGHLAHNVNLSAKAVCGIAAYAQLKARLGDEEAGRAYMERARAMARSLARRAQKDGHTSLTFAGEGWSMKYNLVWDLLFDWQLLDKDFYRQEIQSYLGRMNEFGLPLDSRADYTKSDWIAWVAAMADDQGLRALLAPVAEFLRKSSSRVPFSDWYDTRTGQYVHFKARSVQGGMFMPLLAQKMRNGRA